MSDCCSTSESTAPEPVKTSSKVNCVSCGSVSLPVERLTLLHQLKHPQLMNIPEVSFHFCVEPDCDLVYFGDDKTVYRRNDLRQDVGQKSTNPDRTLCYCFDVKQSNILEEREMTGQSQSKAFVMEQVKLKRCACDTRNPSGQCCLKDFPKN